MGQGVSELLLEKEAEPPTHSHSGPKDMVPMGQVSTVKMQLPGLALSKTWIQSWRRVRICILTSSDGNSDGVCLGPSDPSLL